MDIKAARRTECVSGEICAYWLAGRCNRNPCRFLHGEKLSPPMACSAYPYAKQSHSFAEKIPEYNSKQVLIKKGGGGVTMNTRATQKSSSICKYWINGNCIRGDKCWNLHSWFSMEGISTLAKLQEHKKAITGITPLVGSDKLYSSSNDGTVQMWDCNTGTCTDVVTPGAEVGSMIREGLWVFVGVPNAVKAWNIQTDAEFVLDGPRGQAFAMVVANDALFAGAQDGIISVWRGSSETKSRFELVTSLSGHTRAVVCLAVGGKMLFFCSVDHSIKVWDLDTLQCTVTLKGHIDVVLSLIYWDQFLLSGSLDCTVKVWVAIGRGTLEVIYTHKEHVSDVTLILSTGKGRLFVKQEVQAIEKGPGGLFFTGDGTGLLMVWKWLAESKLTSF